jgi:hypothetical protein
MKKTQKLTVGLFGIALIVLLALPGCENDDGGTPPTITTPATMQGGKVGEAYNQTLAATGDKPITWSVIPGTLPTGIDLAPATGAITGTPMEDGTFSFTVTAINPAGMKTKLLSMTIDPADDGSALTITTVSLPEGKVGEPYNYTLTADGDAPITWSIAQGNLPTGLGLAPATGAITGSPYVANTYTFTVKAVNDAGEDTKEFLIKINFAGSGEGTAPTITTASLPNGTVGAEYNYTLTATGDAPIRWLLFSGEWPLGLELEDTTGIITGSPRTVKTYSFTLKAENAAGADTKDYTVTIAKQPVGENEVAGKSLNLVDTFKTDFNADLTFEVLTWEFNQDTWVGGYWGHYSKGSYTYDSTEKTVALSVTHIWREDDNGVSKWMTRAEVPEARLSFTPLNYRYEITTDGSLLGQRFITNNGTDELAGQTYYSGNSYVFDATGNTYTMTKSGVITTGTYYYDSSSKSVFVRPILIGGKTMDEHYESYNPADYWGDQYAESADIKAAVTNYLYASIGYIYYPDNKILIIIERAVE